MHVIQLHIALLTAAGYKSVNADTWQTHFNAELNARHADWPTLEAALQAEREPVQEQKSGVLAPSKKRKRAAPAEGAEHPLSRLHYHTLSASLKLLLLYLHTGWMLQDERVHDVISETQMRDEDVYGQDDDHNRYWLYCQPQHHCQAGRRVSGGD